ncbi:ATP-binding protein [Sphingobium aromaticiconvertens]|uniref:ATP-binding protein n=1 Tax=Sphingobium aromaticiconvertens TaxID=365341 RepID=UPI00301994FE
MNRPFNSLATPEDQPMNALVNEPRLDLGDGPRLNAQLTNMGLCLRTLLDCQEAGGDTPRMGLFYGFSGYGKTVAAAFAAARTNAIYIHAQSIWTQRSMLEALAEEMGLPIVKKTAAALLKQIIEQLNNDPQSIIIDEMDHLVHKKLTEIIRDIHDATRVGILMIGEEALPSKLKEWERFDNRILVATAAQPASITDALKLRDHYCTRIKVEDDLVELFTTRCKGITRRIVVNLKAAQRSAAEEGLTSIDRTWWGARPIVNGDIAVRRRETV